MLDLASWIVSAAVPFGVAALAGCLAIWLRARARAGSVEGELAGTPTLSDFLAPFVLGLGWTVAVIAGLAGQRWQQGEPALSWWPEEFWQRGFWAIVAVAVVMGATAGSRLRDLPIRWTLAGVLAIATAAISLAGGEGWDDMLPLHQGWGALLATTCLLGLLALDRLSLTAADRWFPLVVLATLAGPMLVAAATYGALVQWTVAAVAATLPIVLLALLGRIDSRTAAGMAYPAVAFATILMAAGRFRSYDDHPWWTYLGMLLVPVAIVLVDLPLRNRHNGIRAAVAAVTALIALGASALLQYRASDPGAGEW
ncbi:MAG TPA: hypothetical protein VGN57_12115 [Pirellulaceae bacterium]|jgi:hypothetical protein|nr:hypothetical protein [Pirellulaceae bacterium]